MMLLTENPITVRKPAIIEVTKYRNAPRDASTSGGLAPSIGGTQMQSHPTPRKRRKSSIESRFWAKVKKRSRGCWEWTGFVDKAGYARVRDDGGRTGEVLYAHRVSFEIHKGTIPEGLEIDHLCRNRQCVNPEHLEAVTHKTNVLRGASPMAASSREKVCFRGHPMTPENYYRSPISGKGLCRVCRREKAAS